MTVTMMPKAPIQPYFFGARVAHALLDQVEVEHERVRRHDDDEDADDQAERDADDRGAEAGPTGRCSRRST